MPRPSVPSAAVAPRPDRAVAPSGRPIKCSTSDPHSARFRPAAASSPSRPPPMHHCLRARVPPPSSIALTSSRSRNVSTPGSSLPGDRLTDGRRAGGEHNLGVRPSAPSRECTARVARSIVATVSPYRSATPRCAAPSAGPRVDLGRKTFSPATPERTCCGCSSRADPRRTARSRKRPAAP